ncbi:MAG: ExbD/TolR family protein, partial [Thiohalomonadales bacterium]
MNTANHCPIPKLDIGKPEISMAPLVDIVFLLLIFFMVTTVFPNNNGLVIEKPTSENAAALLDKQIIITLDKQGQAYLENRPVTLKDI